jgi:hypothetical protein
MGPSGVSSQAAKSARGGAGWRRAHDFRKRVTEAAAGLVAGVELRHDHALAGANRLECCAKSARPGVFDEGHPEALLKLTARGRRVDVERIEIRVAPALVGRALDGVHERAHDVRSPHSHRTAGACRITRHGRHRQRGGRENRPRPRA